MASPSLSQFPKRRSRGRKSGVRCSTKSKAMKEDEVVAMTRKGKQVMNVVMAHEPGRQLLVFFALRILGVL